MPVTASALLQLLLCVSAVHSAFAFGGADFKEIGEISGSGLLFKDIIKVSVFKDPKVEGVRCYLTDTERPLTERLFKNFFGDPSSGSLACVRTGKVRISENIKLGKEGEEILTENKSLLTKKFRVRRIFDAESKTLVYVGYNTRLRTDDDENKSRFSTTTCAVYAGHDADYPAKLEPAGAGESLSASESTVTLPVAVDAGDTD